MDSTIQKIINFDKEARLSVNAAKTEAERITAEAEKKRAALSDKAKADTAAKTQSICDEIRKKSDAEIEKVKKETDEKCRRLDEAMKNSADEKVNEIIRRIFEGA